MAEVGNPAAKDHDALLVDAESIVKGLTGEISLVDTSDNAVDGTLTSFDFCENLWSDIEQISFFDTGPR